MKKTLKIFLTSFLITMLMTSTAFALLWVAEASESQNGGGHALLFEITGPERAEVTFMGKSLTVALPNRSRADAFLKEWGVLFVPRTVRLVSQWGESVKSYLFGDSIELPEPEYKNALAVFSPSHPDTLSEALR